MLALIFEEDAASRGEHAVALIQSGFEVTSTDRLEVARACLREEPVDILILGERVHGRVSHALALMAEYRNPLVATLLLTPRTDPEVDDLFQLLPSLHCILPPDVPSPLLRKLAHASVIGASAAPPPLVLLPSQRIDPEPVRPMPFVSSRLAPAGYHPAQASA